MIYKIKTIKLEYKIQETNTIISKPESAFNLLKEIYKDLDVDQEHFCLLALNSKNKITGYKITASGGQTSGMVDPKIIFRNALLLGAVGIILAHNHPSGDITPSQDDIELTLKLTKCAEFLEIKLLDHIVFSNNKYYSFADNSLIKETK